MARPARPLVIAHRGASGHRPENTAAAFALAVEMRAHMIETDLHTTRDGAVVLTHDAELEGLGGTGEVAGATWDEIAALDAGDGQRVPRLAETLDAFGKHIPWNLEIKRPTGGFYPGLEATALAAVVSRGLQAETLFSCFWDPPLEALRALSGEARLALLLSPRHPERALERARAVGAEAINPWDGMTTPELVAEAHAEGLAVYPFTVDAEEDMRRFLGMGVDGLFTNFPDRMLRILREDS